MLMYCNNYIVHMSYCCHPPLDDCNWQHLWFVRVTYIDDSDFDKSPIFDSPIIPCSCVYGMVVLLPIFQLHSVRSCHSFAHVGSSHKWSELYRHCWIFIS